MNDYEIIDNYGYKDHGYLNNVIDYALNKLEINNTSFTIIFIDDEEIHVLNKEYRNVDKSTDVISFAFNDQGKLDLPINLLGDIYISIPTMKRQAVEYNTGEKRELAFLTIHGLLHLLGYDHMNKEEEEVMFKLQEEILHETI